MKRFTLAWRDFELTTTLTRKTRLMSLQQVNASFWPFHASRRQCRRRLAQLEENCWLKRATILAHPPLKADQPLYQWAPGDDDPDSEEIAEACQSRWACPAIPTDVIVASEKAANLMGSTACGLPRPEQWNHDLHLSQVFVMYRRRRTKLAQMWVGEHSLPKAGYRIKDPDAFLVDRKNKVRRVIECAGKYDAKQVESFHDHCADHDLPYELW
ncbi:MAG: hypothetical protein KDB01_28135 [Planctomycetaceae bacterium]|nr:hypothetical protein [Planctomycetaceae bacterium]